MSHTWMEDLLGLEATEVRAFAHAKHIPNEDNFSLLAWAEEPDDTQKAALPEVR
jgi:hypothetical protein